MLQCVERKHDKKEKSRDGKTERTITTYTYDLQWKSEPVNSNNFKGNDEARRARREGCRSLSENPRFPVDSSTQSARALKAGSFDATRHLESVPIDAKVRLQ